MEDKTDKESVVEINERLHFYVRRVRQLRNESDLDAFYKSIAALEDEIKDTKKTFAAEIAKLKYAIEILNREKAELEKDIIERKNMEAHLNDRLHVEVDKGSRYCTEIGHLKNQIVDKDYQIRELQMTLNQAYYENSGIKKELEDCVKIIEDLQRQLGMSKTEYQDTTSRLKIVEEKLSFQEAFTEERMSELKRRIEIYLISIAELENKIEEGEMREALFPDQLKKVKENSEMEIRKFQKDTEEFYKTTIVSIQTQLEDERKENKKLQLEIERLVDKNTDFRNEISTVRSELTTLEQQKRILNQNLESERNENLFTINTLEKKVKELQQNLMIHLEDANHKQEMNESLRTELDAIQALLSEEEGRLGLSKKPAPPAKLGQQNVKTVNKTVVTSIEKIENKNVNKEEKTFTKKQVDDIKEVTVPVSPSNDIKEVTTEDLHLEITNEQFQSEETSDNKETYREPETPRGKGPIGPIEKRSNAIGPIQQKKLSISSDNKRKSAGRLGEGRDYFEELFDNHENNKKSPTGMHDVSGVMKSSALGDIKILEVNPEGLFVRILNSNDKQEAEFGDYALKQNIGGHPIAVFRFPHHTKIAPNSTATVWSGCNESKVHKPPTDYYWTGYERFNTGPECTTVVCDPVGNAIAWTSPYHRYTKDLYFIQTPTASTKTSFRDFDSEEEDTEEVFPDISNGKEQTEQAAILKKEKITPCYVPSKHPHGHYTGQSVHPKSDFLRTELWHNDNCSVNRQSRSQSGQRLDPVPGEPYTGAENQILGSARVLKHYPATLRKSATLGNRAPDVIMRSSHEKPSPFSKPHSRFNDGMLQIQSMLDPMHLPPMPRPQAT